MMKPDGGSGAVDVVGGCDRAQKLRSKPRFFLPVSVKPDYHESSNVNYTVPFSILCRTRRVFAGAVLADADSIAGTNYGSSHPRHSNLDGSADRPGASVRRRRGGDFAPDPPRAAGHRNGGASQDRRK